MRNLQILLIVLDGHPGSIETLELFLTLRFSILVEKMIENGYGSINMMILHIFHIA